VFYRKIVFNPIDPIDELLTEDHTFRFRHITTVLNVRARKTEIERNSPGPCADDTEISNQPIQGVHHEMNDFITLFNSFFEQNIRESVCLFIKLLPCDLSSFTFCRNSLNQCYIIGIQPCIPRQDLSNMNIQVFHIIPPKTILKYWNSEIMEEWFILENAQSAS
jgi:hypothetical protein